MIGKRKKDVNCRGRVKGGAGAGGGLLFARVIRGEPFSNTDRRSKTKNSEENVFKKKKPKLKYMLVVLPVGEVPSHAVEKKREDQLRTSVGSHRRSWEPALAVWVRNSLKDGHRNPQRSRNGPNVAGNL